MAVEAHQFFAHVRDFMDYRQSVYDISPETMKSNTIDLGLFEQFIRTGNYDMINGQAAMDYQTHLKQNRSNCGSSLNRKIFTLKAYTHYLKLKEVDGAFSLPFDDLLKVRNGYRQRPDQLEQEQLSSLFRTIDQSTYLGIRDYAVYALMYMLGLRVGEVHTLDLSHLDLEQQKITVTGKGKRKRTLDLTDEVMVVLGTWLVVRKFFLSSDSSEALFLSKKGNRLAIRTMQDNFKKLVRKAKLNKKFPVTCHTLRHSFASHLNEHEVDVLVIQDLLGHCSPRSTEIYIHTSRWMIKQALEKIPVVRHLQNLIDNGHLNLIFQRTRYHQRE